MRHTLFNLLCLCSALLAVALIAMTIASWQTGNILGWRHRHASAERVTQDEIHFASLDGSVAVMLARTSAARDRESALPASDAEVRREGLFWFKGYPYYLATADSAGRVSARRFSYHWGAPESPSSVLQQSYSYIVVPWWAAIVPTLLLPAWWIARRSRRRYKVGLCTSCGYDLRATPDRCPECGKVASRDQ